MAGGIPDRVAVLIERHISSVEQLEVLLLLRRDPDRVWTAAEAGAEVRTLPESVALRLRDLHEAGLVESDDGVGFRFSRKAPRAVVDELAECYRRRRVAVIAMIFAERGDDPVRDFADAFRLRKDEDD